MTQPASAGLLPSIRTRQWAPCASRPNQKRTSRRKGPSTLFEDHKAEYAATPEPAVVEVGPARYLAISGSGELGAEFQKRIGLLYGAAYSIKFGRMGKGQDFVIGPLEGIYWAEGHEHDFVDQPKSAWRWTLMIRVPDFLTDADVAAAVAKVSGGAADLPAKDMKLEKLTEGKCVQMLHVGPYEQQEPSIRKMHDFAKSQGLSLRDRHHEIYMNDPRSTPAEKLETILRQPVSPVAEK